MNEFLVELTPGRELLYRTPLALRAAIRTGEITEQARIFHRATSTWVPITEHPEFRRVRAEPPPVLEPAQPLDLVAPPPAPQRRGIFRSVAELGAALATSGLASIRKHLEASAAKSEQPAEPPKPGVALKPASSIQAGQPIKPAQPESPGSTRDRWTFFP